MNKTTMIVTAAGILALVGCEDQTPPSTTTDTTAPHSPAGERVADAAREASEDTADAIKDAREELANTTKRTLDDLGDQVAKLRDRASEIPEASREAYNASVRELDDQLAAARAKYDEMTAAAADRWETFKSDVQAAVDRVGESIRTTRERYGLR